VQQAVYIMYPINQALLQEKSSQTPRLHTRHERRPVDRPPPHQRIIMLIIRQIRTHHAHLQRTPLQAHFNLSLIMRLVNHRNRQRAVCILKGSDEQIFRAGGCVDAHGAGAREAEVACEGPEAARDFEGIVGEAHEDGVAAGGGASVVLGAPPVQVTGCVAVGESVMPVWIVRIDSAFDRR
jgi:hypothetical protein